MNNNFKIYQINEKRKKSFKPEKMISIIGGTAFYLNTTFMSEIEDSMVFCNIYFDEKNKKIGFIFRTKENKNENCLSVRFRKSIKTATGLISSYGFLNSINIKILDVLGRYIPIKSVVNGEEMWIIDLCKKIVLEWE